MAFRKRKYELIIPFEKDGRRGTVFLVRNKVKVHYPERVFRRALVHFLKKKLRAAEPVVEQEEKALENKQAPKSFRSYSLSNVLIHAMKYASESLGIIVLWEGISNGHNFLLGNNKRSI